MKILPLPRFAHAALLRLVTAMMRMRPLSTDLYVASLPSLVSGFGVPVATVQLTLSLFVIGFGSAQLVIGPLSDRFGRRSVLPPGLGLEFPANALGGVAPPLVHRNGAPLYPAPGVGSGFLFLTSASPYISYNCEERCEGQCG